MLRERITICRRDIAKMIETGVEAGIPAPQGWPAIRAAYAAIVGRLPRTASRADLEPIAADLTLLADEVFNLLEACAESSKTSANESQNERHYQNSNPDAGAVVELISRGSQPGSIRSDRKMAVQAYPLGMVMEACPDIADYARGGIADWRDLVSTVTTVVRPMLGISPSAWESAREAMGEIPASITVAAMLQRAEHISSAGGYLRDLTRRAEEGRFSLGPMLMALMKKGRAARTGPTG